MSMDWERLFCDLDDFCQGFEAEWRRHRVGVGVKQRVRDSGLSLSEVMTLIIAFHLAHFRNFKHFSTDFIARYHRSEFPRLVSYSRFMELVPDALLRVFLNQRRGPVTGLSFIDATSLMACHPKRAHTHRVLDEGAAWGKTSVGWFYGVKLHLVINDEGELRAFKLTSGTIDDRIPVPGLTRYLFGSKLIGDKGYISQRLFEELFFPARRGIDHPATEEPEAQVDAPRRQTPVAQARSSSVLSIRSKTFRRSNIPAIVARRTSWSTWPSA